MKLSRGDISERFEKIKQSYLDVASDSRDQIEREHVILNAYQDFRGALKQSEVLALEVLKKAQAMLDAAKSEVDSATRVTTRQRGLGSNWHGTHACDNCRTRNGVFRSPRIFPTT